MKIRYSLLTLFCLSAATSLAADWPQFLGPDRNSTSKETGLLQSWGEKGPAVLWQKEIGEGFSAPVVVGERLIPFHRIGNEEIVECLDAASGKELWRVGGFGGYVCPSVVAHEGVVYVLRRGSNLGGVLAIPGVGVLDPLEQGNLGFPAEKSKL